MPIPGTWHAILEPEEITINDGELQGWKIHNLTASEELVYESKPTSGRMGTCIDGFSRECISGKQHVILFQDAEGKSRAYIRASVRSGIPDSGEQHIKLGDEHLEILYHTGPSNTPPDSRAIKAFEWLKQEIENGNISVQTSKKGNVSGGEIPRAIDIVGFDPAMPGKLQEVFNIFSARQGNPLGQVLRVGEKGLIPKEYRHLGVQDFLNRPIDFETNSGISRKSILQAIHDVVREEEIARYMGATKDTKLKFRGSIRTTAD